MHRCLWPATVTIAMALLVRCSAAADQTAVIGSPIVIEGKFDTATEQLLIPVRINQASLWCSLDSGFSALIVVDRERAVRAGLTVERASPTPDGAPTSPTDAGTTATVNVGGVTMPGQSIILRHLPAEAPDMECIVGVGLLKRFIVEFDYMVPRVRLYERSSYRTPTGAREIPLIFRTNPNVPFIDISLVFADGTRQAARVVPDTGATYYSAVFVSAFVRNVRARIPRTARPANRPESTGGQIQLAAARPAALSVGPFTVREPVVALLESDLGSGGIDDGLLGCGFFRRFTVAFDYEGRRVFLTPNERLVQRQAFDASGVGFRQREGGGYAVDVVLPGSAAARAGVREGDTLVEIDGRSPRDLTPVQLREVLSRPGATCDLRLERDGIAVHIVLRLADRL
jgi:PDZ domain